VEGSAVRLDLFFMGMQNSETTASAWLATRSVGYSRKD
jgi:hypothetical protein